MKSTYHYFPFIIISFLLYALFFYFHETLLPSNQVKQLATKKVTAIAKTTTVLSNTTTSISDAATTISKTATATSVAATTISNTVSALTKSTSDKIIKKAVPQLAPTPVDYQRAKIRHQNNIKNHLSADDARLKEFIFNQTINSLAALPHKKTTNSKPSKAVKNVHYSSPKSPNDNEDLSSIASTLPINNQIQVVQSNKLKIIVKQPPEQVSISTNEAKSLNPNSTVKAITLQEAVAISGKKPKYPQRAALRQQKGQVKATMIVMKNGQTMAIKLTTSSGHEMLDKAVLNFIKNERFMPALKGQEKINSEQSYSFSYQ